MIPVFRSLAEIPADFGPTIAAIGNFDGVHLGHRRILNAIVAEARQRGARAVAVTFDPHPERFLRPADAPLLLTPIDERLRLLSGTGIDAALVLRFDEGAGPVSPRGNLSRQFSFARFSFAVCTRAETSASATAPRRAYRSLQPSAKSSASG